MDMKSIFHFILLIVLYIHHLKAAPYQLAKDKPYWDSRFKWVARPINNDDEYYAGGIDGDLKRKMSSISYAEVGAGWGR